MKTIDRYVLRKIMAPLAVAVSVAMLALLLERLIRLLDFVINQGGPFYVILKMLVNLIPYYLGIALPAAFFIGTLLAVMRLSADSELDAAQSFGVGLQRLLRPILLLTVLLTALSWLTIGYLQPYTRYAYRALVYAVTHTAWYSALDQGSFFTGFGGMTVLVEDIDSGGRRLRGIFVHEELASGGSVTTTAAEAELFRTRGEFALALLLRDGARQMWNADNTKATVVSFEELVLPLDVALVPEPFRERGEQERELTLSELWQVRNDPPPDITKGEVAAELHGRLVRVATLLALPFFAIPLGVTSRRAHRGARVVAGLAVLVIYHHLLQFGEALSDNDTLSVWLSLWLPFSLFMIISLWSFYGAAFRPGQSTIVSGLEATGALLLRLRDFVAPRRQGA